MTKIVTQHNHQGSAVRRSEVLNAIEHAKVEARGSTRTTASVVNRAATLMTLHARGHLPSDRSMKRMVQRNRVAANGAPPNPETVAQLVIPQEYQFYEDTPGHCKHSYSYSYHA